MNRRVRLGAIAEYARGALWVLPSLSVLSAIVLAMVLVRVEVPDDWLLADLLFPGGAQGARGMLQAVATSVITVTTLVFSLTLVTLQLASTQFSPRLLRTFLRRPANQVVMSVFLATFVYALVVLRTVRDEDGGVPELAVSVGFVFALCVVAALVYFIHHITSEIRADTLMQRVEEDTLTAIGHVHPDALEADAPVAKMPDVPDEAVPVPCSRSGVVQAVNPQLLGDVALDEDAIVVLVVRPGDRVVRDGIVAWTWTPSATPGPRPSRLSEAVNHALTVGHERTMQQDVAYGLRQLVDIAVKALSTGMNDPTTAVDATAHLGSVLSLLATRHITDWVVTDRAGAVRVHAPRHTFAEYLHLACSPIRRYGAADPDVVIALLRLLRDVAQAALTERQRDLIRTELELVLEAASARVDQEADRRRVSAAGRLTSRAVAGARAAQLDVQRAEWAAKN